MNESISSLLQDVAKESQERARALDRLLSAADPAKVFSQPVALGDYTADHSVRSRQRRRLRFRHGVRPSGWAPEGSFGGVGC